MSASSVTDGGVSLIDFGSLGSVRYVAELAGAPDTIRLAAAVAFLGELPRDGWWRRLKRRYLGDVQIVLPRDRPGWIGGDGVRVHPARRLVEVLGTRYPLLTGDRALVILVDQTNGDAPPVVAVREIPSPRTAADDRDAWRATVRADPVVRAFLERAGLA